MVTASLRSSGEASSFARAPNPWSPWGVQLAGAFFKAMALAQYRRTLKKYRKLIAPKRGIDLCLRILRIEDRRPKIARERRSELWDRRLYALIVAGQRGKSVGARLGVRIVEFGSRIRSAPPRPRKAQKLAPRIAALENPASASKTLRESLVTGGRSGRRRSSAVRSF